MLKQVSMTVACESPPGANRTGFRVLETPAT
jgi:hypothetical protein